MGSTVGREILGALRLMGPLRRQIARLTPDDVGPGGLMALRVIAAAEAEGDHARVSDVAAAQHVGLPVASRQVRQLEDQGLLTRAVSPDDRRAHRLALTEDGLGLMRRVEAELTASIDDVLADWPPGDAAELARLMGRLHEGISRLPDPEASADHPTATPVPTLQESTA